MKNTIINALLVAFVLSCQALADDPYADLIQCNTNLRNISHELEHFASLNRGKYPKTLSRLETSFDLLRFIPTCPVNGATYSYKQMVEDGRDTYFVSCPGEHKDLGFSSNEPFYNGIKGLGPVDKLNALRDKHYPPRKSAETCCRNLDFMAAALESYNADLKKYPTSLKLLVEKGYMEAIPACPVAGKDTYSEGYRSTGGSFHLQCTGSFHRNEGYRSDYPAFEPYEGLIKKFENY